MVYKWNAGVRYSVPAQVVGERLDLIRGQGGGKLTPSAVVEDAKSVDSPIHPLIEHDRDKAAYRWQLHQARNIINSVRIVHVNSAGEEVPVRSHLNITDVDGGRSYVPLIEVIGDEDKLQQVERRAKAELATFRDKYTQIMSLRSMKPVFAAIDACLAPEPRPKKKPRPKAKRATAKRAAASAA